MLEKYAVSVGGGSNHRMGLDDGVLIKDNHLAMAGGVVEAVRRAREAAGHLHKIEVEVATLEQVKEALGARADILLLDNMTPETVAQAVQIAREGEGEERRRTLLEASGECLERAPIRRSWSRSDLDRRADPFGPIRRHQLQDSTGVVRFQVLGVRRQLGPLLHRNLKPET